MKRLFSATLFALLAVMLFALTVSADTTLTPTDDTWVDLNDLNANKDGFGLLTDYSNLPNCLFTRRAFLRYDLSSLAVDADVGTSVRLYVTSAAPQGTLALLSTTDDWNGGAAGNGGETTLTWSNAPTPLQKLATAPTVAAGGWVEFRDIALNDYLNAQRAANGGDNIASLVVRYDACSAGQAASISFEDTENFSNTGNAPELFVVENATPDAVIAYQYDLINGESGNGTIELYLFDTTGAFLDSDGTDGIWKFGPSNFRIFLQYRPGQRCSAIWVGDFTTSTTVEGIVLCRDGSATFGTWQGTIVSGAQNMR
ncbi:MAG: DUF7594 domain-containing protein [Ardenticatenaceae bacterium]